MEAPVSPSGDKTLTQIPEVSQAIEPGVPQSSGDKKLSRREALGRLASSLPVMAAGVTIGATSIGEASMKVLEAPETGAARLDAELFALERELDEVEARIKVITDPRDAAYERYDAIEPPQPEELRIRPEDGELLRLKLTDYEVEKGSYIVWPSDQPGKGRWDFRRAKFINVRVDTWEEIPPGEPLGEFATDYVFKQVGWETQERAQARADEIVNAYQEWARRCDQLKIECGIDLSSREDELLDPLYGELWEVRDRIFETRARTFAGMLIKLRTYDRLSMADDAENGAFESLAADVAALASAA